MTRKVYKDIKKKDHQQMNDFLKTLYKLGFDDGLASATIDYDVLKNTENTMVIEMLNGAELPQYGFDKKYDAQCNLWLKIFDEVEGIDPVGRKLTGAYLNQTISGQGTTSMNYFRWNLR